MKRRTIWLILIVIYMVILLLCTFAQARTIYVNNDGLADFNNIQAAIDDANNGDVVIVKSGTYTGDGNRDIDFKGKAITVRSEAGPESCIIDCKGSGDQPHRGFYFHSGEDTNSVVKGFTITGGDAVEAYDYGRGQNIGGGIYCEESSPHITDCIITANIARMGGGIACIDSNSVIANCIISNNIAGLYPPFWVWQPFGSGGGIETSDGCPMLINCVIIGNRASNEGGGINCCGNLVVVNCTINGNLVGWQDGFGGGISFSGTKLDEAILRSCILWENMAIGRNAHGDQIARLGGGIAGTMRLELICCTVQDGTDAIYTAWSQLVEGSWISDEPHFANPGYWDPNGTADNPNDDFWVDGDYHLKSQAGRWEPATQAWVVDDVTSPCIDAGDPASPIGYEPFPNGGRINIGAYGGTAEASKSYFGKPPCETIIAGDINGDCKVDFRDFAIMAGQWLMGQH